MNQNTKRLLLLNLPYVLMGLYATNLGYAEKLKRSRANPENRVKSPPHCTAVV